MSLFEPPDDPRAKPAVLSVSQLIDEVRAVLDERFPEVWVKGEISSFKHHGSGHMYFSLKDERAVLSCAFFKFQQRGLRFTPRDGMQVEARSVPDLYAPRGQFQLRVLELRPAGIGALLVALEALKKKLAAEGVFDAARKRPLPAYPRAIGLVTSPTGAAIRDLLHVLQRRWQGLRIVLAPVPVQGPGAAAAIAEAIRRMNRLGGLDLLIVGRGGGSLEDLWAFNEEVTVRAVASSAIPIVSAVGHEVDVTLCDFAADVRAATPSAAAELVTPDRAAVRRSVRDLLIGLSDAVRARLEAERRQLAALRAAYGFRRSTDVLALFLQRVDDLLVRGRTAIQALLRDARADVRLLVQRVAPARLRERVRAGGRELLGLERRLVLARERAITTRRARFRAAHGRLLSLSPRAVLGRGYSLVFQSDGTLVTSASQLEVGEALALELARGRAAARVTERTLETDLEGRTTR